MIGLSELASANAEAYDVLLKSLMNENHALSNSVLRVKKHIVDQLRNVYRVQNFKD